MTNAETNETAATVAEPGATVAPEKAASKKTATRQKGAPKRQKAAAPAKSTKSAKPGKKAGRQPAASRQTKGAKILELIGRPKGATLAEIMQASSWQAHSVRGFISTAGKKHGVKIESLQNEAGGRVYRTAK